MRNTCWTVLVLISLFLSCTCFAAKPIIVLEIANTIGPATQDYIQRGLADAEDQKAELVILRLDTPGGLETSMRGINKAILASTVPVVAYVAPAGARAASAGTFILYASHIAAMAPGTNLGAASPVNVDGIPSPTGEKTDQKNQQTLQKKEMNDAVAYIRSLAQLRDRNVQWAELAVRETVSLSAEEALKQNVINLIANNTDDLLQKLNGQTVEIQNAKQTLQTKDIFIIPMQADWRTEFLSVITNPSVAYILLLIGIYGLFFEFANPGFVMPGIVGVISLLLALYAFQLLPISYVGLSLLLIGIACMVAEVFISTFGVLGIGGIIAFITGSIMLLDTNVPGYSIAWSVILVMSLLSIGFILLIFMLAVGSFRKPVITGREALIGSEGEVLEYHPDCIIVRVQGEIWTAQSETSLHVGQKIQVKKISNLILTVDPILKVEK